MKCWRPIALGGFLLVLAAVRAGAETVRVRSGEHEGFTRLVLPLPDNAAWRLERSGETAQLLIDAPDLRFDTGDVFARIPRSRVRDLAQKQPGAPLEIRLGCACQVTGFIQGGRFLVLDVSDPRPAPRSVQALPLPVIRPVNLSPYRFDATPPPATSTPVSLKGEPDEAAPARTGPPPKPALEAETVADKLRANAWKQRLVAQIERATGQGLLKAAAPTVLQLPARSTPAIPGARTPLPPPSEADDRQAEKEEKETNISVTSVVNRGPVGVRTGDAMDPQCPAAPVLDLPSWGGAGDFASQIGAGRVSLYSDAGRTDPEAALALARNYLYFGFGAEAHAVLALPDQPVPDAQLLDGIAAILDDDDFADTGALSDLGSCGGDAALWSFLAAPARTGREGTDAVLLAFSRLPPHLRRQLGPRLASALSKTGAPQAAAAALRAADRTGADPGPAHRLAEAGVAEQLGDSARATRNREAVAKGGSDRAPEALVELVEARWQTRATVQPDIPDLVAAYAVEFGDTPSGPRLRNAEAIALALGGRFAEAVQALGRLRRADGLAAEAEAASPVFSLLAERGGDIEFLRHALGLERQDAPRLSESATDAVARRLLDLGMARPAVRLLDAARDRPGTEERRLLRAEAALDLDRPHRALVELLGVGGESATRLRAQALVRTGNLAAAAEALSSTSDHEAAARASWLAGTAAEPAGADAGRAASGRYARIADLSARLETAEVEVGEQPTLAAARALIEASEKTRNDTVELLSNAKGEAAPTGAEAGLPATGGGGG